MAKRSRQSFLKRQRERQRAEKAAEKRMKRLARRSGVALETEGEREPGPPIAEEPQGVQVGELQPEQDAPAPEDGPPDHKD